MRGAEVASDQKCPVKEATPSASSTEQKVRCVTGSVFDLRSSSSRCTRWVWLTRTWRCTSSAWWKPAAPAAAVTEPGGSAARPSSSKSSQVSFFSCGQRHCMLKNTCSATPMVIWLPCRTPSRRSCSACLRTRAPDSRIQATSSLSMSTRSRLLSCRAISSSCSVCAALEKSLAEESICVRSLRASKRKRRSLRMRTLTPCILSSSSTFFLTDWKGARTSPLTRAIDFFSASTTSRTSPSWPSRSLMLLAL
mmetsp:Transcript_34459/g.102372  ORF Transcript_34459/g.102372 Transcript_34459/m.102372 type:complete len:251 (-) Transcript_34459:302-1054(-)